MASLIKMTGPFFRTFIALGVFYWFSCGYADQKSSLRLNHIQVIGSHNSYKKSIEPPFMDMLLKSDSVRFATLDYSHVSLTQQLDLGLRKLELDVFADPDGGRYARPAAFSLLASAGVTPESYDTLSQMDLPGFKVMHVQDIDFRTHCQLLQHCLQDLLAWSQNHPDHIPITISVNAKSDTLEGSEFVAPIPFDPYLFDALDETILSVIPRGQLLVPDDIRGEANSLREAILRQQWPELDDCRGSFLFVLDEQGAKRDAYIKDHPSLNGRVMFVNAPPDAPEAAILIMNDPITAFEEIQSLVRQGFLVRTRADADTKEARTGDFSRYERALASGAHFISTDYYLPDTRLNPFYQICLPGSQIYRLNPLADEMASQGERRD